MSNSIFLYYDVITGGISWTKSQLNAVKMWLVDQSTNAEEKWWPTGQPPGAKWVNNAVRTSSSSSSSSRR